MIATRKPSTRRTTRRNSGSNSRGSRTRNSPNSKRAVRLPPATPDEIFDFGKAGEVGIVFWCKKCHEIIEPKKGRGKRKFSCPKCDEEDIIFGTQKSVQNYTSHQKDHFAR